MKLSASMIALGMGIALTSVASFADPVININIPLGQTTTLRANQVDTLSLSALGVGEAYKVTCQINDPNNTNSKAVINVSTSGPVKVGYISNNGQTIGLGYVEHYPLSGVQNTLVVDNVVTSGNTASLVIKNASSTDNNSIVVSQCIAQGESTAAKK
jgi:hypothetical protein